MANKPYGPELILDLYDCSTDKFTRAGLKEYFEEVLKLVGLKLCVVHFWDDIGLPPAQHQTHEKTKGTSAIAFLIESNCTVHTLDLVGEVYVNLFSCVEIDTDKAADFTKKFFGAEKMDKTVIQRGEETKCDPDEGPDPVGCGNAPTKKQRGEKLYNKDKD